MWNARPLTGSASRSTTGWRARPRGDGTLQSRIVKPLNGGTRCPQRVAVRSVPRQPLGDKRLHLQRTVPQDGWYSHLCDGRRAALAAGETPRAAELLLAGGRFARCLIQFREQPLILLPRTD